jgi:hypothetical protein
LDRNVVTESLISTVAKSSLPKQKDLKHMDRNTFVREVLTLFHVGGFSFATQAEQTNEILPRPTSHSSTTCTLTIWLVPKSGTLLASMASAHFVVCAHIKVFVS